MEFDDREREERLSECFARQARDFDDRENEMAGREVGRIGRFVSESAPNAPADEKRKTEAAGSLTNLQILLKSNSAYAALYRETAELLNRTQSNLDGALERVQIMRAQAEAEYDADLDKAARLADGRRVFKDRGGAVRFKDGDRVDEVLAATILWKGDEPGYEDIRARQDRLESLDELEANIRAGQAEIGVMQERMQDETDPVSSDEIEGFKARTHEIADDVKEGLDAVERTQQAAPDQASETPITGITVPKI